MRRATITAVVLSFIAVFCAIKVDDRPWLLWQVTVAGTTGAMTNATIATGPQPWAPTLTEALTMGGTNREYFLGQQGVDVHWSGRDCQLGNSGAAVELQVPGRAGIMVAAQVLTYWLALAGIILFMNCVTLLPELLKMMRGDALSALLTLVLSSLICGGIIALPALSGSAVSNDYSGFLLEETGCSGSATLLAQFVGVRWESGAWLAASVVCGVGAVAAGWRMWPVVRARLRGAADLA